jgi:hypothetical protein
MSMPSDFKEEPREKLARIFGQIDGELQNKFEEFAKSHDIIDWNITQEQHSMTWSMFIRYKG